MAEPLHNDYERLSCGHQNNLLLTYLDGSKNKSGECPKGCQNVEVQQRVTITVAEAQKKKIGTTKGD